MVSPNGLAEYVLRGPDGSIVTRLRASAPVRSRGGASLHSIEPCLSYALADEWEKARRIADQTPASMPAIGDLAGRKIREAFVDCVVREPKVQAHGRWLRLEFCEFASLFDDGRFPTSELSEPTIINGYCWPFWELDPGNVETLALNFAQIGGCSHYQPSRLGALRGQFTVPELPLWDSFFFSAQAIANAHHGFLAALAGSGLIASGPSETLTPVTVETDTLIRPGRYLDVQHGDLFERSRRIMTGFTLDLAPSAGATTEPAVATRPGAVPEDGAASAAGPNVVSIKRDPKSAPAHVAGKPGRREVYDWAALKPPLEDHVRGNGAFATKEDLARWCIENVRLKAGARRPKGNAIDLKNAKAAIEKHKLHEIGLVGLTQTECG